MGTVGLDRAKCMWCGRGYPPASPTREHVLPDYLGVSATLERGQVCSECNHRLNKEVDEPFRDALGPVLAYLGVRTSKRPVGGSSVVEAMTTNVGSIAARLRSGKLEFPPRQLVEKKQGDGAYEVMELWVCTPDQKDALVAARREVYGAANLREAGSGVVQLHGFRAKHEGQGAVLHRAVAKAGVNLLAYRQPDLLATASLRTAMRYVQDSRGQEPDLLAEVEAEPASVENLRPEHLVSVAAQSGGECWFGLFLFGGDIAARVRIADSWDGPPLLLEETFQVKRLSR